MISIELAQQLKAAGLVWTPEQNDFFIAPDRGMDDMVFVTTNIAIVVERVQGELAMKFHGASEWALDYVFVTELVWLPTESQLRRQLEKRLVGQTQPLLALLCTSDGYRCEINYSDQQLTFEAFGAGDAYALALLHLLEQTGSS